MQQRKSRHKRSDAGFTLLEIMLVVGIITIMMGSAIYFMTGNVDVARSERARGDINAITTQLRTYEMQNLFLPTTEQGLDALINPPATEPKARHWIRLLEKMPLDPWGMPYVYRYPGIKNPQSFDLFSTGPDRVESADDIGNWDN